MIRGFLADQRGPVSPLRGGVDPHSGRFLRGQREAAHNQAITAVFDAIHAGRLRTAPQSPRAYLNSCWTMNLNAAKPPKMAKKPETFMKKWAGSVYHNENLPKRS